MTAQRAERRLAAILAIDVVGYSRLMGRDEAATLAALAAHRRALLDGTIDSHKGRIVKLTGDGILVEFASVVGAVGAAIEMQRGMAERNADVTPEQRIEFRMGVHLGDILVQEGDIFGDGVNVAARIESVARPGGVCVSAAVRDNITSVMDLRFADRGEQQFKNIERPVRIFDILLETSLRSAGPKADDPARRSIAVLPFSNMSGDPEQEYFSDGITEDIITNLSCMSALGVLARNTTFQFKNRNVDVPQIARQLRVSHVLEGSVRKAGERVRITAQLIDGTTGEHIWADRYDRDLSDIFAVQDEISRTIADVLKLKLLPAEKTDLEKRSTSSAHAYKLFLMARHYSVMGSHRHMQGIIRLCKRAIELDPDYAAAWALLSITQSTARLKNQTSEGDPQAAADRAIALDPALADAHAAKARILVLSGNYAAAKPVLERALALDPNCYEANIAAARAAIAQQQIRLGLDYLETAAEVYPDDYFCLGMMLHGYAELGDKKAEDGVARRLLGRVEKVIVAEPDHGSALSFGVMALYALGEHDRANDWIERGMLLDPDNDQMCYNFGCGMLRAGLSEAALDIFETMIPSWSSEALVWAKADPDLTPLHGHPRFVALIKAVEDRLAVEAEQAAGR